MVDLIALKLELEFARRARIEASWREPISNI